MADESKAAATDAGVAEPTVDELRKQLEDARAERDKAVEQSRKWESRSKSNAERAKKYDELAAQSMTDAERLEAEKARADEAEAKLAAYEAQAQRAKDAAEVSAATGVPANLLVGDSKSDMERHAADILAFVNGRPSAQVFPADGAKPDGPKGTPETAFHEWFNQISK